MSVAKLEYIWLDGYKPMQSLRSKTKIEKDFLRVLMGGCSTPISALAEQNGETIVFRGNICSPDGAELLEVNLNKAKNDSQHLGEEAARQLLNDPKAKKIIETVRNGKQ